MQMDYCSDTIYDMYYSIPEKIVSICKKFAADYMATSKYSFQDRQIDADKFQETVARSKACEYAVYQHLRNSNKKCTLPDIKIYDEQDKSYDADIYCYDSNTFIHVKSINKESVEKYGLSWIVSKYDPVVKFPQSNHWYALTVFKDYDEISIIGWLNASKAIYKPTQLNHPTKKAIYYNDVKHLM